MSNEWQDLDQVEEKEQNKGGYTYEKRLGWINSNQLPNADGSVSRYYTKNGKVLLIPDQAQDGFDCEPLSDSFSGETAPLKLPG